MYDLLGTASSLETDCMMEVNVYNLLMSTPDLIIPLNEFRCSDVQVNVSGKYDTSANTLMCVLSDVLEIDRYWTESVENCILHKYAWGIQDPMKDIYNY